MPSRVLNCTSDEKLRVMSELLIALTSSVGLLDSGGLHS